VGVTDGRGRGLYSDDIHLHEISRNVRACARTHTHTHALGIRSLVR
jgi:hypothetical protein